MPRRIRTVALQASGGGVQLDGYFDRVVKYIPADVVGAWVAVSGIIKSAAKDDPNAPNILWIAFAVGVVATGLWVWRQTTTPPLPSAKMQIIISVLAFAVWVFALGGPFSTLKFYHDYYGSLLLIGFTLFAGMFTPKT